MEMHRCASHGGHHGSNRTVATAAVLEWLMLSRDRKEAVFEAILGQTLIFGFIIGLVAALFNNNELVRR